MSFKVGDFVVATKNSPYDITNSNMLLGIVTKIEFGSIFVEVLAHTNKREIGGIYEVSSQYFELVEDHPLKHIFENYNFDYTDCAYNFPFLGLRKSQCFLSDLSMDIGALYSEHPEYNVKELLHCASVKLKGVSIYKKS